MSHQLPTPPTTSSGSTRRSRHRRRAEASSSSESALGQFGISNLSNRIVAPPRPLPLETVPSYADSDTDRIMGLFGSEFKQQTRKLMSGASTGVDDSAIRVTIVARMFRDDPDDIQPTLLIVVDDQWTTERRKAWETVVSKLKCYVDGRIADTTSAGNIDVCVEMVSKTLVAPKYLSVVTNDEPGSQNLIEAWPRIRDVVLNTLESYSSTAGCMTAIALFRLGYSIEICENPKTVYISVDYNSAASGWPPVLDAIQNFLDTFEMDLKVHIEHGLVGHRGKFHLVPSELTPGELMVRKRDFAYELLGQYSKQVTSGSDMAAGRYITRSDGKTSCPMVGTLGCWIQIKIKDKGWTTMGLTCYHVVRPCFEGFTIGVKAIQVEGLSEEVNRGDMTAPVKDSACWNADVKGVSPKDTLMETCHSVEHPPRLKHNINVTDKKTRIDQLKKAGLPTEAEEKELQEVLSFFNNDHEYFGKPFFASGYLRRTEKNGRLDWALIRPFDDSRVGGNPLPRFEDFSANGYLPSEMPLKCEGHVLEPQATSLHSCVKDGAAVHTKVYGFKKGASTRCTVGQLSHVKTTCRIAEEKHISRSKELKVSTEFVFGPADHSLTRFGHHGDSGAVVFDKLGKVMGLLFRGGQVQQCETGYSLVTPIEDVFNDIKEFSRGVVEEIRLLGEGEASLWAPPRAP